MTAPEDSPGLAPSAGEPIGRLASVSIDCPDPATLADFYGPLLGMSRAFESPDGRVVALSDGTMWVTLMKSENHVPPTWPEPGQAQQMHLDLAVVDLEPAVAKAVALGAREAAHQPNRSSWRVLLDPAGHPFCLTTVTAD